MSAAKSKTSDAHWDTGVPPRSKDVSKEALGAYKTAKVYSCHVKAGDGTKLAVDVLLPKNNPGNAPLPCVLFQARYTRGLYLRFPVSRMTDGRPYDFINLAFKAELLLAGYAVTSMDFRGTGASFGKWKLPWGPIEREDSCAVLDWMTGQPWCNGKVVLCGQSYDATAALFTASLQHPAVKGCVALYPFWDLYNDIAIPGGIAMKSFTETWGQFCRGMDYNDFSLLQSPARQLLTMISRGCNPVVCYDGARLTACSFHDMKKSVSLLVSSLIHPIRLLTLRSPPPLLAAPKRSKEHPPQPSPRADAVTSSAPIQPCTSATPQTPTSSQQPLVDGMGQAQLFEAPTPGPSESQAPKSSSPLPVGGTTQHRNPPSLESRDDLSRQLSLDAAKEQHAYHSWARGGNLALLQDKGPVVNAQTIPARGANADGVSAGQLHISVRRHYKEKGKRLLQAAVAEHDTWDSAAALKIIRFSDEKASQTNATTADVSLCSQAKQIRQANIPLHLVSGWLDSTAAAAINLYHYCGQAAGSELVIGPWAHGGLMDQSAAQSSSFNQPKHSLAFVNRCCDHTPASAPSHQEAQPPQQAQQPQPPQQAQQAQQPQPPQQAQQLQPPQQPQPPQLPQPPKLCDHAVPSNPSGMFQTTQNQIGPVSAQPHMGESQAGLQPAPTPDPQANGTSHHGPSKEEEDAASPSVHFFMMGDDANRGWKACHSWPPPGALAPPLKLFLNKASEPAAKANKSWFRRDRASAQVAGEEDVASQVMQEQQTSKQDSTSRQLNPAPVCGSTGHTAVTQVVTAASSQRHPPLGRLTQMPAQRIYRFRHDVDLQKHPKGLSRYDAISKITKTMHYDNLDKCGHLTFTSQPLQDPTQVVGAVGLELWVESSGPDVDVFAYLADIDVKGCIRYVSEGMFRASHRKEYASPPQGHPRAKATLPGEPFHSFTQADTQHMPQGAAVLCCFQMLPTAYTFAEGHSMRIAIAGADAKHFYVDHVDTNTMWIHSGPDRQSVVSLYTLSNQGA